jgi:acyl-CoA synthetase (AMP-forming)/AMP-acid ligase II/acyl carrier protein
MPHGEPFTNVKKTHEHRGIYGVIDARAQRDPEAIAILAPGRKPLSYGPLRDHIEDVGKTLNTMGIGRNSRIAIVLPNGPEMAVSFLAVAAFATSAPLNPNYIAGEFEFYLSDLNAEALIVQSGLDCPARTVAQMYGIPIIELTPVPEAEAGLFTLRGEKTSPAEHNGFAQPDDVALVLHTSGTTSRPKIVPLSQSNICSSAQSINSTLKLTRRDRCLNIMPLFHIHGLIGVTLTSMAAGASVICSPGFDADKFYQTLKGLSPTWYSAVPTMHQAVLARSPVNSEIIRRCSLRFIRSSSASLPPTVMRELEGVFGVPVIESYGMTEASHQMTSNPLPPLERKPGSVGIAAGPEVALMDEAGNLLPQGEIGEIVIRGANVTLGYEKNPEANQEAFTNGWFRTGDQGCLDNDGYLIIQGRLKEIINRGGEKVSPREVDEVIIEHPAVAQVVTFAVPHETLGEDVAAAVVLNEDTAIKEQEIRDFAFETLADFKVPSQIVFVEEIPKGPTGKLQRIGLAEKLASNLKAEFIAPQESVEKALAGIWSEVLGIERISVNDNFFALGGDSLRAAQVVARVRNTFQVELPLRSVFRDPTLAGQAWLIEEMILEEVEQLPEEEVQRLEEQYSR